MSKYRVLFDKGTDWPTSERKINNCAICKYAVLAENDAYWIVSESQGTSGSMRLTCSEECANMFILQRMDGKDDTVKLWNGDIV